MHVDSVAFEHQVNIIITHDPSIHTYIHSLPAPVSQGTSLALQGTSFASLASQRTSMTRYVDQPFHTLQIGVKSTNCQDDDNGENLYEAVGPRPLPALPEEDYEPNGYICRVDSIPGSKPAPLGKKKCYISITSYITKIY